MGGNFIFCTVHDWVSFLRSQIIIFLLHIQFLFFLESLEGLTPPLYRLVSAVSKVSVETSEFKIQLNCHMAGQLHQHSCYIFPPVFCCHLYNLRNSPVYLDNISRLFPIRDSEISMCVVHLILHSVNPAVRSHWRSLKSLKKHLWTGKLGHILSQPVKSATLYFFFFFLNSKATPKHR